jgi:hypothetical protein
MTEEKQKYYETLTVVNNNDVGGDRDNEAFTEWWELEASQSGRMQSTGIKCDDEQTAIEVREALLYTYGEDIVPSNIPAMKRALEVVLATLEQGRSIYSDTAMHLIIKEALQP